VGTTIRDVAELAGVSTATVSRVINNDARISEKTRNKVLLSISRLNYKVNTIARSLKINRTYTIGVITPEIAHEFFMTVAQGIENQLRTHGYDMIVCNANESVEQERERIELLLEKCVDGLIIIPSSANGSHMNVLTEMKVPVVLVDRLVEDFRSDAVLVDNTGGCYRAIEHLIRQGYRRFGFIGGDHHLTSARERFEGFMSALKNNGIEPEPDYIVFGDFHERSGYDLFGSLASLQDPPEIVFVSNYNMHIGAAQFIVEQTRSRESTCRIPYIASFDDMVFSAIAGHTIVTVSQPVREIGARAADLLVSRLNDEDIPFPSILRLPTRLVVHTASPAGPREVERTR